MVISSVLSGHTMPRTFGSPRLFVRLNNVAIFIANANQGIMRSAVMFREADCIRGCIRFAIHSRPNGSALEIRKIEPSQFFDVLEKLVVVVRVVMREGQLLRAGHFRNLHGLIRSCCVPIRAVSAIPRPYIARHCLTSPRLVPTPPGAHRSARHARHLDAWAEWHRSLPQLQARPRAPVRPARSFETQSPTCEF